MKINKYLKIAIISILILLLNLGFASSVNAKEDGIVDSIGDYEYKAGHIWAFSYINGSYRTKLKTGDTYYLMQNRASFRIIDKKGCFSVNEQPNIWCVERGKSLTGYFTAGEEKTVKDPLLEYILYNGPDLKYMEDKPQGQKYAAHNTEKSQNALWHYIANGGNDYGQLTGLYSHDWDCTCDGCSQKETLDMEDKENFYNAAVAYSSSFSLNPSITCTYNEDTTKIEVRVSGNFTNFDLYVNGSSVGTYSKTLENDANIEIDASNYEGNVTVKVVAKKTVEDYTVKYRILENGDQQKLLVLTDKSSENKTITEEASTTVYIEKNVNVSLQKYITHVNNIKINENRRNRKATDATTNKIYFNSSSTSDVTSQGVNKYSDVVEIEPGDSVTYTIEVYNNGEKTAKEIVITDNLPLGVTKYSINGGSYKTGTSFTYPINNLGPYESRSFYVTVYFGEYRTDILENAASITSTNPPKNDTDYRKSDSDFVKMVEYKVSLEKYITKVKGNNIDNELDNTINILSYSDIINYIEDNNINLDTLINNWAGRTVTYDEKYDINDDGKIDESDISIYNKLKANGLAGDIDEYINSDINDDGYVDETDLNIYKIVKANLQNDELLNNYDRYMFILKSMYDNDIDSRDAINFLYVQRLVLKTNNKDKNALIQDINNYLNSDVNDDGYVDINDNYKIEDNSVKINEESYPITEEIDYINSLQGSEIEKLKESLEKYDINKDKTLNKTDLDFYSDYGNRSSNESRYYYISQRDYTTLIGLDKVLKEKIKKDAKEDYVDDQGNIIDGNIYLDFNGDLQIYFDDATIAIKTSEELFNQVNDELKITRESEDFDKNLDFDNNNIIDYTDYEILTNYINFLSYCHNNVQDQDRVNTLKNGLIQKIAIKQTDSKYDSAYDLNRDNKIDFEDYAKAQTEENVELINAINNLLTISNSFNYDINFDFNKDNKLDYLDLEFLTYYYIENIEDINIDAIITDINHFIGNYSIFDRDEETKDFSEEDINAIKVYKGWKNYNEDYNSDNFEYELYDINFDGLINSLDIELINNKYENISSNSNVNQILNLNEIDSFIEFLKEKYNDNTLSNIQLDSIVNSYDKLNTIITNVNSSVDIKTILSNTINMDKISKIEYSNIEIKSNIDINNLDINNDGKVTVDDKNLLTQELDDENISEIESFDKSIITNNDINGDGQVDQSDIEFYEKLIKIRDNSDIKNAITNNNQTNTPSGDGAVTGRENHPIYDMKGYSKEDNKIRVEVGDTVTYTIKLTNTGNYPIKVTEIVDTFDGNNNADLVYAGGNSEGYGTQTIKNDPNGGKFTIHISNAPEIAAKESIYFTMHYKVEVPQENTNVEQILRNTAEVTKITNKKDIDVTDSDGVTNNKDSDWIQTHVYQVSLEKYVAKVESNGKTTEYNRAGKAEHKYDDNTATKDSTKVNNVVTVENGDKVTYTIKVKNDSTVTGVYITEITDYFPNGVKYNNITYNGKEYDITKETNNKVIFTTLKDIYLRPGEFASFQITVEVIESNMSVNILRNVAKITGMKNKNEKPVEDSTKNNNKDADYIQMRDIIISGTVWNDLALNKTQNNYNGLYESQDEKGLSGIEVKLYRTADSKVIKTETTDSNGYYKFDLDYIKGPKVANTNRWNGNYYSYYIIFEYDGITYTSTPDGKTCQAIDSSSYTIDSNAREDNNLDKKIGVKSRTNFNNEFSTINNTKGIGYTTKNENGYIPQSNHGYNSSMDMQSSTSLINIGAYTEDQLKYIGLGLRGRDIFDLELISAVDQIKITVNKEQGVYRDTNTASFRTKVTTEVKEDMANVVSEKTNTYLNNEEQEVRESDYNVDTSRYAEEQGISHVEVRYKITVQNTSITKGTATKITNYYDSNYTFVGAYSTPEDAENYVKELTSNNVTGDKYGYVTIDTPSNMLNQSDIMEIYVVYTLNNPSDKLEDIDKDNPFVTLNMAEIIEYKTEAKDAANEATRGLIDKDSAPGSVNREQVRLTTTEGRNTQTINGNPTTVEYYFNKLTNANIKNEDYLKILKYEDDTYATPTIFKAAIDDNGTPDNPDDDPDDPYIKRTITGTVFEDYTTIIGDENEDIRVKTGDGIQDTTNNVEPGVQGITVGLYEMVNNEPKLRFIATTDKEGKYTFEGYLPGNYIVKYEYGDTNETFLLNNDPNTKSYNGEDFQSTNNTGKAGGQEYDWIKTLSNEPNYWYVHNEAEGISAATDVVNTRQTVSTNVTSFNDHQMTVLNNARDGMKEEEAKVTYKEDGQKKTVTVEDIINATNMEAKTKSMKLTMERTVLDEKGGTTQYTRFADYIVGNMNFGIAEVPVTTIDLQKHVHSFTITDSTGSNPLAGARVDTDNTSVVVNASKIAVNRLDTVINVLSKNLGISKDKVRETINYDQNKLQDINITIAQNVKEENKNSLKDDMTKYSLAREIKILYGWKVTAGAVKAYPGASTINVELEDDKLQGAKLEITYEVSANIYAEKNFNNEAVTVPTIEGMVDYIDNDLSYDANKKTTQGNNSNYWSVTTYENVQGLFEGQGNGTVDSEGTNYSTIVSANEGSEILQEKCGEGTVYITLEKVLSSPDSTLADVILNTVDSYEYSNTIEITKLNYENQTVTPDTEDSEGTGSTEGTGGSDGTANPDGEDKFVFKDRVRTPDRFIIVPGMSHDYESAETIVIIPPLGDSSIHTVYYIIAAISLVVVVAGVIGIKKFVIKK